MQSLVSGTALVAEDSPYRLALSAGVLLAVLLVGKALQRYFSRSHAHLPAATRRGAFVTSRNLLWTVATLLLVSLWLAELRHVALSVAAIATGLLLAGRELVMAVLGRLLHASTRPFSIGDVVEIGTCSGQVIDVSLFTTTLLEMDAARQYSGHVVELPNAQLLTGSIRNLSHTGRYVIESLRVPVPADDQVGTAIDRLQAAMASACGEHVDAAVRYLAGVEAEQVLTLPDFQPRVLVEPKDAFQVDLIARFPVPAARRAYVAQAVLKGFYASATAGDGRARAGEKSERPPMAAVAGGREGLPPSFRPVGGVR